MHSRNGKLASVAGARERKRGAAGGQILLGLLGHYKDVGLKH